MTADQNTQPNEPVAKYKRQLIEARNLRSEAGVNAFERATLLVAVHDDPEFQAEFPEELALSVLDEHVDDLCLTFLELRQMLKHRPEKASWTDGKLRSLYAAVMKEIDEARPEREAPKRTVNRVTQKEYAKVVEENARNAERADGLGGRCETQASELERLRADVARLQAENGLLRAQVAELQEMLRGEPQGV